MEYIIGIGVILTLLGGIGYTIYKKVMERKAPPPMTEWKCIGCTPPAGLETALEVIKNRLSWVPPKDAAFGGIIEWVAEPYYISQPLLPTPMKVAGTLENFSIPHVKVVAFHNIWETALAHEILHIYWIRCYHKDGDGEQEFYDAVGLINRDIKAKLSA